MNCQCYIYSIVLLVHKFYRHIFFTRTLFSYLTHIISTDTRYPLTFHYLPSIPSLFQVLNALEIAERFDDTVAIFEEYVSQHLGIKHYDPPGSGFGLGAEDDVFAQLREHVPALVVSPMVVRQSSLTVHLTSTTHLDIIQLNILPCCNTPEPYHNTHSLTILLLLVTDPPSHTRWLIFTDIPPRWHALRFVVLYVVCGKKLAVPSIPPH